jgi:hypothetical protein
MAAGRASGDQGLMARGWESKSVVHRAMLEQAIADLDRRIADI